MVHRYWKELPTPTPSSVAWLSPIEEVSDLWNWVCLSLFGGCHSKMTVYLGLVYYGLWTWSIQGENDSISLPLLFSVLSCGISLPRPLKNISGRSIQLSQCLSSCSREGSLPGIESLVRLKTSMSHPVQNCSQPQLSLLLPASSGWRGGHRENWSGEAGHLFRAWRHCNPPVFSACLVPPELTLSWEVPLWSGSPSEISANRSWNSVAK